MSEQPQEWTPKWFETTFQDHDWIKQVCEAHNAALAAERLKHKAALHHIKACRALLKVPDDEVLYTAIEKMKQQLADARAKLKEFTTSQ
jgi:hypothetical protein